MKRSLLLLASTLLIAMQPAEAQNPDGAKGKSTQVAATTPREATANTSEFPSQILRTGIDLNVKEVSPNSLQLADSIKLTPILERIQSLRSSIETSRETTSETLAMRQELFDLKERAALIIQRTSLEVDFTVAEILAEHEVYDEILSTFTEDRDKAIARTNALSFISNGALWAVTEALAIPSYKYAKFAIPSGIIGIPAGVVPSIASMYTFKQMNGKKRTSEAEPNMLAKLFNYPTTPDIEYPTSVWDYLHQVPASEPESKTRLNQMIDRWIADANMPAFTDRGSKQQLDVITASVVQKKGLTIGTLTARTIMLEQLQAEICKMKRMLLELTMALQNDKQLITNNDGGYRLKLR